MIEIKIPANVIAALMCVFGRKLAMDGACLRQSLAFETGPNFVRVWASDGGVALAYHRWVAESAPVGTHMIRNGYFKNIKPKGGDVTVVIDGPNARIMQDGTTIESSAHETTVNLVQIVPNSTSGEAAQFSIERLSAFDKAARLMNPGNKQPLTTRVYPNGPGTAIVELIDLPNFLGVISPFRHEPTTTKAPEWLYAGASPERENVPFEKET